MGIPALRAIVEALLPVGVERARTFGSDAEAEVFAPLRSLRQRIGHARIAVAIYGYAAQASEQRTQRPEEPLFLHQKVGRTTLCQTEELTDDKIPVTGVGSQTYNIFGGMFDSNYCLPSHPFIQYPAC